MVTNRLANHKYNGDYTHKPDSCTRFLKQTENFGSTVNLGIQ